MITDPKKLREALDALNALAHEPDCTPTVRDIGCWALDHEDVIRSLLTDALTGDGIGRLLCCKERNTPDFICACPDCNKPPQAEEEYPDVTPEMVKAFLVARSMPKSVWDWLGDNLCPALQAALQNRQRVDAPLTPFGVEELKRECHDFTSGDDGEKGIVDCVIDHLVKLGLLTGKGE